MNVEIGTVFAVHFGSYLQIGMLCILPETGNDEINDSEQYRIWVKL